MRISTLVGVILVSTLTAQSWAADNSKVDPVHSTVLFSASHAGIGHVWGRFNDPAGTVTLDAADPTKDTFNLEIAVANVDTHNEKRDAHLKSPDFFNAKQYPTITFKSTSVAKSTGNTLAVTGAMTVHGVTKTVTLPVSVLGAGQFPPGVARTGLEAEFTVRLSDYEIKGVPGMIGDDIRVIAALEVVKQ